MGTLNVHYNALHNILPMPCQKPHNSNNYTIKIKQYTVAEQHTFVMHDGPQSYLLTWSFANLHVYCPL